MGGHNLWRVIGSGLVGQHQFAAVVEQAVDGEGDLGLERVHLIKQTDLTTAHRAGEDAIHPAVTSAIRPRHPLTEQQFCARAGVAGNRGQRTFELVSGGLSQAGLAAAPGTEQEDVLPLTDAFGDDDEIGGGEDLTGNVGHAGIS